MAKKPTVNLTRKPRPIRCWGIVWRSQNARDGRQESLLWNYGLPRIFETKREAQEWIEGEYGYIRNRPADPIYGDRTGFSPGLRRALGILDELKAGTMVCRREGE